MPRKILRKPKQPAVPNCLTFNIWDDYIEDELIPAGKTQETRIYPEMGAVPDELQAEATEFLYGVLLGGKLGDGAAFSYQPPINGWGAVIEVVGLTHVARLKLLQQLIGAKLSFRGLPLDIISES